MVINKFSLENTVKNLLEVDEVYELVEELFPEILISPMLTLASPYRFCDVLNFIAGKLDRKKVVLFGEKLKELYDAEEIKIANGETPLPTNPTDIDNRLITETVTSSDEKTNEDNADNKPDTKE